MYMYSAPVPVMLSPDTVAVVFINCDRVPFLDQIENLDKILETRTRNTLGALAHCRVLLVETRRGRRPLARCWATIGTPLDIRSREDWDPFLPFTGIPAGSTYDWQQDTRVKWLYPLLDVASITPFTIPEGVRHGRVWMEYKIIRGGKSHD